MLLILTVDIAASLLIETALVIFNTYSELLLPLVTLIINFLVSPGIIDTPEDSGLTETKADSEPGITSSVKVSVRF